MFDIQELLNIISEKTTNIDVNKLDPDEELEEQGLDSLDIISTLFDLEEKYNIKIGEDDISQGNLSTINAIVAFIKKHVDTSSSKG